METYNSPFSELDLQREAKLTTFLVHVLQERLLILNPRSFNAQNVLPVSLGLIGVSYMLFIIIIFR